MAHSNDSTANAMDAAFSRYFYSDAVSPEARRIALARLRAIRALHADEDECEAHDGDETESPYEPRYYDPTVFGGRVS